MAASLSDDGATIRRAGASDLRIIARERDGLYARRGNGPRFDLDPAGEDTFVMVGTGGSRLRFERDRGRVVGVEWAGGSARARAPRMD